MQQLDSAFKELARALSDPVRLNPAASKPLYYFVYPQGEILAIRKRIGQWKAMLEVQGHQVTMVSFRELLWTDIDESGRWERWLAAERSYDRSEFNQSVTKLLESKMPTSIDKSLKAISPGNVVLFTEAELLHPWLRTRALEHHIAHSIQGPGVIFYPGRRAGQYGLEFLGFYEVDGNYRSTIYGIDS